MLHSITMVAVIAGAIVALVTGYGAPGGPTRARPITRNIASDLAAESFVPAKVGDAPTSTGAPATSGAPTSTSAPVTISSPASTTSSTTVSPPAPTTTAAPSPTAPTTPAFTPQLVAQIIPGTVQVYANPGETTATEALFSTTEFGTPRILPVSQLGGDWLKVELPTRPNGSEGWIRARDADLSSVVDEVSVDRASRTLVWTHGGVVQLRATVGIGAPSSPTPSGTFFVTDVLPRDPSGSYGAWIVALNGHSDAFTEFEGGDARIAIHGTNDPSSIGKAVSAGCVRLTADPLARLAHALPPGTPVIIT